MLVHGTAEQDRELSEARLRQWCELAISWGFQTFLSPEDGFTRCSRSRRPWRGERPGIYFWLATDGQAYVGQSIVPQARLRQHQRDHGDLVHASFFPCAAGELDDLEAELVAKAQRHFALRNIKLAVSTAREVPFDEVVSADERERFLAGEELADGPWQERPELIATHATRFARFSKRDGAADALRALQLFVARAIPKPTATEVGFWSVTLYRDRCFVRVNVGHQEVFTYDAQAQQVRVLADSSQTLLGSYPAPYQVRSYVHELAPRRLGAWLTGQRLLAVRRLVVQLMRHTTAINSGSHCPQAVRGDEAPR